MENIDELRGEWSKKLSTLSIGQGYDHKTFENICKARMKKQLTVSFRYFWASFTFHVIVYSLLSHVILKYFAVPLLFWLGVTGILIFVPLTVQLLKSFKAMAKIKTEESGGIGTSVTAYVLQHYSKLNAFYGHKKIYEIFLVPTSSVIAVILLFTLYVPGGVRQHLLLAIITLSVALIFWILALRSENKRSFKEPLLRLRMIIDDLNSEA